MLNRKGFKITVKIKIQPIINNVWWVAEGPWSSCHLITDCDNFGQNDKICGPRSFKNHSLKTNLLLIWLLLKPFSSAQFSSVTQLCPTLCNPMNRSTPGLPVHHQLPEFTQTQVHRVGDAIQPSHPLSSPSPPALNPSQHQGLFQWVNPLHEVAKVLEFQLQHQSFQWTPRTNLL